MFVEPWGEVGYEPLTVCTAQRAILNSDRQRALMLVRAVDSSESADGSTMEGWLADLDECEQLITQVLRPVLDSLANIPFDHFALWLDRTRRYSFYL